MYVFGVACIAVLHACQLWYTAQLLYILITYTLGVVLLFHNYFSFQ